MTILTEGHIASMIDHQEIWKQGLKTTVCLTVLTNGFEIITSSACVYPEDYSAEIGEDLCKKKATDKIWELEGYLHQVVHNNNGILTKVVEPEHPCCAESVSS